jgi:hypothetical protein
MNTTEKFIRAIISRKSETYTQNGGYYKVYSTPKFTINFLGEKTHLRLTLTADIKGSVEKKVMVYQTASFSSPGKIYKLSEFVERYNLDSYRVEEVINQITSSLVHTKEEIQEYRSLELSVMRQLSEAGFL